MIDDAIVSYGTSLRNWQIIVAHAFVIWVEAWAEAADK